MNRRIAVAVGAIVLLFATVQLGALALVAPFESAGLQATEDPSDPVNSLLYVGAVVVATAIMLGAFRFGVEALVRVLITFSASYLAFFVFSVVVPPVALVGQLNLVAVGLALVLGGLLLFYPEWYVIDGAGIVMGIGAAALFGISFGVLPAVVLLVVLAVYDAISVYGTEHMLTLASGVMSLKLPVVLVIPLTLSYSFLDDETDAGEAADSTEASEVSSSPAPEGATSEPLDRDAFYIGLGDAVMPAVLVASAGYFAPGGIDALVAGTALTLPALTAGAGSLLGLGILMYQVAKGQAHAGLPLLNGGAIGGYLIGSLAAGVSLTEAFGLLAYV
mgnify:FL=1